MSGVQVILELPPGVLSALRQDPESFVKEMRLAAAVKWYEMGLLSQDKAAEVAGTSRTAFLAALIRYGVSPFQYRAEEIVAEVGFRLDDLTIRQALAKTAGEEWL